MVIGHRSKYNFVSGGSSSSNSSSSSSSSNSSIITVVGIETGYGQGCLWIELR
jgi:hypothetical protein